MKLSRIILFLMGIGLAHDLLSTTAQPSFRSQSVNSAREIVGWQQFINIPASGMYGTFSITPEYTQTFRSGNLARCLFGTDVTCGNCTSLIKVSGSRVENRGTHDWLADYFGLSPDFESSLHFDPRIQNALVDFNAYVGWCSGLYFRIHAPLVYTRWSLNFTEDSIVPGTLPYAPGYFTDAIVGVQNLLKNATAFFSGTQVPNLGTGFTFQPLACSKLISACNGCGTRSLTRLSDIEAAVGWNFWCDPDYVLGFSLRASAPTGNKPCNQYMFDPVIGSGGFWKLGVGINGQALFWCDDAQQFGLYVDAHIQHLFSTCQQRAFDLCGKPNSRYMLAQRLGTQRNPIHLIGASDAGVEFQNEFAPVANLTCSSVNVSARVETDIVLKFAYYSCNWSWDIGYNFWMRSCERICPINNNCALDGNRWALKGDAAVIGFAGAGSAAQVPVRLAAVQADATINSGTNNFVGPNGDDGGIDGVRPTANPGITNPQVLIGANGATGDMTVFDTLPTDIGIPTRSSNPVVFINQCSIDYGGTKGLTNKFFTHISYAWTDCVRAPFFGIGGEIEFARTNECVNTNECKTPCAPTDCELFCPQKKGSCSNCSLNQWGIWIKGGVAFN